MTILASGRPGHLSFPPLASMAPSQTITRAITLHHKCVNSRVMFTFWLTIGAIKLRLEGSMIFAMIEEMQRHVAQEAAAIEETIAFVEERMRNDGLLVEDARAN